MDTYTLLPMEEFIKKWNDCTLDRVHWNHFGHLRAAMYCLLNSSCEFQAISMFRCRTIQYGIATAVGYSCAVHYHHTITVFWIFKVKNFIRRHTGKNIDELEVLLQKSKLNNKYFIHKFYSTGLLATPEAQANYVPPDLKP